MIISLMFLLGVFVTLFIYHILVFIGRKKDKTNLAYAFFNLSLCILLFVQRIYPEQSYYNPVIGSIAHTLGLIFFIIAFICFFRTIFIIPILVPISKIGIGIIIICELVLIIFSIFTNDCGLLKSVVYSLSTFIGIICLVITTYFIIQNKIYRDRKIRIIIIGLGMLFISIPIVGVIRAIGQIPSFFIFYIPVFITNFFFAYSLTDSFNREHDDLVDLKNNLKQKVAERTAELEEEKESKTRFFMNITHEIKTPLTLIINYLEKDIQLRGNSREIEIVKKNLDKLQQDIINIMDIEKFLKKQFIYQHNQPVNISQYLNEKILMYKELCSKNKIELSYSIIPEIFTKIDFSAIERIINNVLDNALKYTNEGGTIEISLNANSEKLFISIKDSGIGIDSGKQKHIFKPYYQISHEKHNCQGLGIGLSIVKRIIGGVGGKIKIDSEINKGTTFIIELVRYIPHDCEMIINNKITPSFFSGSTHITLQKEKYLEGKPVILIVEDNIELLAFLQENLSPKFNIYYALNGCEALLKLSGIPQPDIIISDIMMDKLDGYGFYDKLIKDSNYNNIPFIFLTAKNSHKERIEYLEKGIIDYIFKPFYMHELTAKIKSILKNSAMIRQHEKESIKKRINQAIDNTDEVTKSRKERFYEKCLQFSLSSREKEVAFLLSKGLLYKEIAAELHINEKTVSTHIQRIYTKTNTNNKIEFLNLFIT